MIQEEGARWIRQPAKGVQVVESDLPSACAFLERDILSNIVPAKMICSFASHVRCLEASRGDTRCFAFVMETAASEFDILTYPNTRYVVMFAGADRELLSHLVDAMPTEESLVFKVANGNGQAEVERRFSLRKHLEFFSYTNSAGVGRYHPEVRISQEIDPRALKLYELNGYSESDVRGYVAKGAFSAVIYDRGDIASVCLCFPNYGDVWEVGALRTPESYQRRGYAQKIVESVARELEERKLILRYGVRSDNSPSIHLAERMGLRRFMSVAHYVGKSRD